MEVFVILAAVLLSAQAATVPPVITHKVSAPLPGNVLALPRDVEPVEVPAVVVEVPKDHKHNPDMPLKLMELTTVQPVSKEVPEVVVTTIQPLMEEISGVMVTTVQPSVEDVVSTQSVVEGSGSMLEVTSVQPVVKGVSIVSTTQPEDGDVTTTPTVKDDTSNVEDVNQKLVVEVTPTVVPLIDDMVTNTIMDEGTTTVEPDAEDVQTTDGTTDAVETTVQPLSENNKEKGSNDNSSEEDSSSSSESTKNPLESSKPDEGLRGDVLPAILSPPHIKDETTVPHITPIPPITADDESGSSSSSSEEDSSTLSTVPLQIDRVVVVRHRRAQPFFVKSNLATAKPKLTTNPKVIADIVAKSKNVHIQRRVMRSVVGENVASTTPTMPVAVDDLVATIDPCDLLCTKFEIDPICASNGLCLHEFPNQCIMDTYNCRHPKEKFSATRDDRCKMHWLEFCNESDMI